MHDKIMGKLTMTLKIKFNTVSYHVYKMDSHIG